MKMTTFKNPHAGAVLGAVGGSTLILLQTFQVLDNAGTLEAAQFIETERC